MSQVLINLAIDWYTLGEWDKALNEWQKALALTERLGDVENTTALLVNLGAATINRGYDEQAEAYLMRGLALSREHNLRMFEVSALTRLADLYIRKLDNLSAENWLKQAERIAEEPDLTSILCLWAEVQLQQNKVWLAHENISKSLQIADKTRNELEKGIGLRVSGQILFVLGKPNDAFKEFEKSLEILSHLDPYESARAQLQWAEGLAASDKIGDASSLAQEAYQTFQNLGAIRDIAKTSQVLHNLSEHGGSN